MVKITNIRCARKHLSQSFDCPGFYPPVEVSFIKSAGLPGFDQNNIKGIVLVDSDADTTAAIVSRYVIDHPWIQLLQIKSSAEHQPGTKVVHAFNKAYANIDEDIDLIGKFDADIILPSNYFEILTDQFRSNSRLGLCSGILYIKKAGVWEYEAIADKSHIRGPVKLYRKECLDSMNGLRPGLGWDTADVMLAQFYGFETKTLPELHVYILDLLEVSIINQLQEIKVRPIISCDTDL